MSEENSCWACLVIIDQGAKVCPFCGADQTPPPAVVVLEEAKPRRSTSTISLWVILILVAASAAGVLLWYVFGGPPADSGEQAEATAAESLRDTRTILSEYALSAGGAYPSALEALGDKASAPIQAARDAGYAVVYTPEAAGNNGSVAGFVLQARPENPKHRSLYIDQSGILRATEEDRPANAQDPPI